MAFWAKGHKNMTKSPNFGDLVALNSPINKMSSKYVVFFIMIYFFIFMKKHSEIPAFVFSRKIQLEIVKRNAS